MEPCAECTAWSDSGRQHHGQQQVLLPAGSGKCPHTNELCPALQWGHKLSTKLGARSRMKYKCSHCAQQGEAPTNYLERECNGVASEGDEAQVG